MGLGTPSQRTPPSPTIFLGHALTSYSMINFVLLEVFIARSLRSLAASEAVSCSKAPAAATSISALPISSPPFLRLAPMFWMPLVSLANGDRTLSLATCERKKSQLQKMQSNLAIPDNTRVCLFPKWVFYIEVFDNISPKLPPQPRRGIMQPRINVFDHLHNISQKCKQSRMKTHRYLSNYSGVLLRLMCNHV